MAKDTPSQRPPRGSKPRFVGAVEEVLRGNRHRDHSPRSENVKRPGSSTPELVKVGPRTPIIEKGLDDRTEPPSSGSASPVSRRRVDPRAETPEAFEAVVPPPPTSWRSAIASSAPVSVPAPESLVAPSPERTSSPTNAIPPPPGSWPAQPLTAPVFGVRPTPPSPVATPAPTPKVPPPTPSERGLISPSVLEGPERISDEFGSAQRDSNPAFQPRISGVVERRSSRKRYALVVDDNMTSLKAFERILLRYNVEVLTASTVGEALQQASMIDPIHDGIIAFIDVVMPGMNGPRFVGALRQLPTFGAASPIVLISSLSQSVLELTAADWGAAGFILKSKGLLHVDQQFARLRAACTD